MPQDLTEDRAARIVRERLSQILAGLDLKAIETNQMPSPNSYAEYDPRNGYIFHLAGVSDREYVMVILHELVHAYLHRPGPDARPAGVLDEAEERVAHYIARFVCNALGLIGYEQLMSRVGVPPRMLDGISENQQAMAHTITTFLVTGCGSDHNGPMQWPPLWALQVSQVSVDGSCVG